MRRVARLLLYTVIAVAASSCAPRVRVTTPLPEPPRGALIENVRDDLTRFGPTLLPPGDTGGANRVLEVLRAGDPVIDQINSWYAETDAAWLKADELHGSRSRWNVVLKAAQFGGSGAATASTGFEEVDGWIGVVGGIAAFLATAADAGGVSSGKLERQIHCEDLWFDRIQLKSWATQYAIAKAANDVSRATQIRDTFLGWVDTTAKRKYEACFSRTKQ